MRRLPLAGLLAAAAACGPQDPHIVPRPDNLREDRRLLSAPILQQPIYACAQSVVVKGFVPGATLKVLVNGTPPPVGSVTSWLSDGQNVIVSAPFVQGQQITVTQTFGGATSGPSNSVAVTDHTADYPGGLPDPRLDAVPCLECGKAVGLADYVPGALVRVFSESRRPDGTFDPPAQIGEARDWTYAILSSAFTNGSRVWATQELCTDVSPRSTIEVVQPTPATIPAPILDPVHEGVNLVTAWGPGRTALVHGAQVDIFADNQPAPGRVGGQPTPGAGGQQVYISPPAAAGKYWATQALCATVGTGTPVDIVPCAQQPPATIRPPLPGDTQIELLTYIPGARILVFANGVEIGDGGGPVLNLTRPLVQGETIVVLQRIGSCDSGKVYQIPVDCSLGGDAKACSAEWPMFRHNALRNASQPNNSALADPNRVKLLREIWRFDAPPSTEAGQNKFFRASPVVHNNRVFVGNANGFFYARDAATGAALWQFPLAGGQPLTSTFRCNNSSFGIAASAAIANYEKRDLVIFGAPDRSIGARLGSGRLFALDAATGALVWQSPELAQLTGPGSNDLHEQFGYSAPVVVGDVVYVGIADHCDNPIQNGRVVAVRLANGQPLGGFSFSATGSRGGGVWSSVAAGLDGGGLYVTTGNTNTGGSEPSPNHGLSLLRLDPASGAVVWKLQPVPFAMDYDPDWSSGAALLASSCGQVALSTMKDGWSYAAAAGSGSAPTPNVRWQFPWTGWPFTPGDGTRHGDSRYLVPGAAWKDVSITMAGGELLTQEFTFTDPDPGALAPQLFPGFGKLHALNVCAPRSNRVRWMVDVPSVAPDAPYQLGPPTVTRGIVFVGTAAGDLVVVADPSVWPAVTSRCVRTDVLKADCVANGFALVPVPRVLLDLPLNAGTIRTEPVLAGNRVFVTTMNGTLVALATR
jgi:outer membrane protein assembly factor BamB